MRAGDNRTMFSLLTADVLSPPPTTTTAQDSLRLVIVQNKSSIKRDAQNREAAVKCLLYIHTWPIMLIRNMIWLASLALGL